MSDVIIATVNCTPRHQSKWRFVSRHLSHLHRAGVGTHEHAHVRWRAPGIDPKGILHISCRMVLGEGKLFEVVGLELNLWSPGDFETERTEDAKHLISNQHHRVTMPASDGARWQTQVIRRSLEVGALGCRLEREEPRRKGSLQVLARAIDLFTHFTSHLCRDIAHAP